MERSRTPLVVVVGLFLSGRTGAEWSDSVVGGEGCVPDPRPGKKGEK